MAGSSSPTPPAVPSLAIVDRRIRCTARSLLTFGERAQATTAEISNTAANVSCLCARAPGATYCRFQKFAAFGSDRANYRIRIVVLPTASVVLIVQLVLSCSLLVTLTSALLHS